MVLEKRRRVCGKRVGLGGKRVPGIIYKYLYY